MNKIIEKNYKKRIIDNLVEQYLETFGAVCIEGPKWCGKTWTSSYHSRSEFLIGKPDNNFQNRNLAQLSPDMILEGETPRLIDEWQEVPEIWDAVRYRVDLSDKKGQFILTGSSTPNRKGILHSGAGRIGKIRMGTMSLYESGDSSGVVSLKDVCNGSIEPSLTGEVKLENIAKYIVRGGFPGNINTSDKNIDLLPKSYINAIIDDDVNRLDQGKYDINKMKLLLRSLARNESTTVSNARLLKDIKEVEDETIDINTLKKYLDVFERLFLVDNQKPFATNIRSSVRVKNAEKRHFADPALAAGLLEATPEKLICDLKTMGFLFEALCERDLKIYAQSFGGNIYHYQDYKNREIDAVIELKDGNWCAFEIKLGANQIDDAANSLLNLKESIRNEGGHEPKVLCVICGLSNAAYKREDGVIVVPITALKN